MINLKSAFAKAQAQAEMGIKFRPALSFAQAISNAKENLDTAVKKIEADKKGDQLSLSSHKGIVGCIPPHLIERMMIKNKGVTGDAYVKKDLHGHEHVWMKTETGKKYLLSGPEAEAIKAALKAAGPFEKVEVTVKGDLLGANMMTGVPTIITDSASIDVKPAFIGHKPWQPLFNAIG